jgi:hypothetical protein
MYCLIKKQDKGLTSAQKFKKSKFKFATEKEAKEYMTDNNMKGYIISECAQPELNLIKVKPHRNEMKEFSYYFKLDKSEKNNAKYLPLTALKEKIADIDKKVEVYVKDTKSGVISKKSLNLYKKLKVSIPEPMKKEYWKAHYASLEKVFTMNGYQPQIKHICAQRLPYTLVVYLVDALEGKEQITNDEKYTGLTVSNFVKLFILEELSEFQISIKKQILNYAGTSKDAREQNLPLSISQSFNLNKTLKFGKLPAV